MKRHCLNLILSLTILISFQPVVAADSKTDAKLSDVLKDSAEKEITIVALGDSLTEGYGIEKEDAYPKLVEDKFKSENRRIKMINAGISGSTSASALSRLRWYLKIKPDVLLLALGANDGLRGVPISTTKKNLLDTIRLAKENGIQVLLLGMKLPLNYGKTYREEFEAMYAQLANEEDLKMLPFFLDGVAGNKKLNLADGIHPNEEGHKILADTVYAFLKSSISEKSPR